MTLNELIKTAQERGIDFDSEIVYLNGVTNSLVGVNSLSEEQIDMDDCYDEIEHFNPVQGSSDTVIVLSED